MLKCLSSFLVVGFLLCRLVCGDPAEDHDASRPSVQIRGRIVDKNGEQVNLKKWSPYATHNLSLAVPDGEALSFQLNDDGSFLTRGTAVKVFCVEGIFYMDDTRDIELYGDQIRIPQNVSGGIFDIGDIRIDYPPNPVPKKPSPPGVATVEVLDAVSGEAIPDAVVTPRGLCIPNGLLGWFIDGRDAVLPEEQRTDSSGKASIAYPLAASRHHLFGEIQPDRNLNVVALRIGIQYPRYLPVSSEFHRVDGGADPVLLKKGAKLTVKARLSEDGPVLTESVFAQLGFGWYNRDCWEWKNGGLFHGVLPPGEQLIRVAHRSKTGELYFSQTEHVILRENERSTYNVVLEPAAKIRGTLDTAVPRPVKNGWITFHSTRQSLNHFFGSLDWSSSISVEEDGSFEAQLPFSDFTKYAARCDGWVSKNTTEVTAPIQKAQRFTQFPKEKFTVEMQTSSHARITLRDLFGNGIPNATVTFYPSNHIRGVSGWNFAPLEQTGYTTTGFGIGEENPAIPQDRWIKKTNDQGTVEFHDIPSSGREHFKIEHPRFRLIENDGKLQTITLRSGEWSEREIQMHLEPGPSE